MKATSITSIGTPFLAADAGLRHGVNTLTLYRRTAKGYKNLATGSFTLSDSVFGIPKSEWDAFIAPRQAAAFKSLVDKFGAEPLPKFVRTPLANGASVFVSHANLSDWFAGYDDAEDHFSFHLTGECRLDIRDADRTVAFGAIQ